MQVTKITEEQTLPNSVVKPVTEDSMEREFDYYVAQKLSQDMLEKGLISVDEFNKIIQKNRQTFSPFLAEIMPNIT